MHARPAFSPLSLPSAARAWPAWAWIVGGGIALALADLVFAAGFWFLHSGTAPARIPQSIAAWFIGTHAARAGGIETALLGAVSYCALIATLVAVYVRIAARWPRVHAHVASVGVAYGVACYALVLRILVPAFSAASSNAHDMPIEWTLACVAAWGGIGFGCAWIARAIRSR
ncbi:hypothetical protein LK996_04690 [Lysobacter sp. A6]|uniref:Uncharacterized protein n=1 Tax=Noviluteimonas lactosilytica TaxID=2888523 RepID=A0ABS8JFW3_9GAMM|nr:hypothetical protein [Lysobacter lactosilyticus]MCC8362368.1 hypothetical protein [Lysobacter lactosilyticus]